MELSSHKNGQVFEQIPLCLFLICFVKQKVWSSEKTKGQRSWNSNPLLLLGNSARGPVSLCHITTFTVP